MADHEMSISRKKPCGGCTLRCFGAHHSSITFNSSSSFSFYRVMAGNFSFELELPLEIAARMEPRACTDVILTGPSGHLWHVNFRCTDTHGSFTDGWKSFVFDNGIEAGDILVFRHAVNMHFIVQVFEARYCGKEYNLQRYTSSCCREGILSELYRQKSCKRRKPPQKVSVAPVLLVVEREKYKDTGLKKLLGDKEQISFDCNKTTTLSYEEMRKMLRNSEKSIPQNQVPLFQDHPIHLDADVEVTSCSVTNDDSESIPAFSFCNTEAPKFSANLGKSAIYCNFWFTIPKDFADRWLPKKDTEVILLHHKNPGIWRTIYKRNRHGWRWMDFILSNNMHAGDKCAFELINIVNYTFKVYVMS